MTVKTSSWPLAPYKGLGYYTVADSPLFAGRDDDIHRCASLLAEWRMRLLLLHGSTGCGKSSFLRAGLIPHLESAGAGIAFARSDNTDGAPVLFVSSTADPLSALANAIYNLAGLDIGLHTPTGPRLISLRGALGEAGNFDPESFRRRLGEDPAGLLEILENLSRIVPETLVIIIDQGEEVLTGNQDSDGDRCRDLFFEFLTDFSQAQFDLKLLIALRTEYFGRFVSRARRGLRITGISEYYLDELSDPQIIEAVMRPTSIAEVNGLSSPHSLYQFDFKPGVVEGIIRELGSMSGRLPALQIVCNALYDKARSRPQPWVITLDDLDALGGVAGSIERFLDERLYAEGIEMKLTPVQAQQEAVIWKEALHGLARPQPDGTITTELKREFELRQDLQGSRLDFDRATAALTADNVRILRRVNVVDSHTGALIPCFGLGHDTLGLVLRNWKVRYDRERELAIPDEFGDDREIDVRPTVSDIALCLSGGGYRAMLFHLGALWRLNELGYLPRLGRVSGVSSGAILAGFLGAQWKELKFNSSGTACNFVDEIVRPIRQFSVLTLDSLNLWFALKIWISLFWKIDTSQAQFLVEQLDTYLFGRATLQDLPDEPDFVFSAANVQHASLFRFGKAYLGSRSVGYIRNPSISLATAVASSAAMPLKLSPIKLKFRMEQWSEIGEVGRRDMRYLTDIKLVDGSIQDNLGLEAVWRRHRMVLVSDGTRGDVDHPAGYNNWAEGIDRWLNLSETQLLNLHRRQILDAFRTGQKLGAYWSVHSILSEVTDAKTVPPELSNAHELAQIPTRFAALSDSVQERLINWGYAVCAAALRKHMREESVEMCFPFPVKR